MIEDIKAYTEKYCSFVKTLKKTDKEQMSVYMNNSNAKRIVITEMRQCENIDVYRTLAQLHSDYICNVYDVVSDNDKIVVFQEYIDGATLDDIIDCGRQNVNGALKIIRQICCGLSALHSVGIVHRDIKPQNIMIDNSGNAKIIDFNISRIYKHKYDSDTKILGTSGYAAPEQYGINQTDERADIFALGVLLNLLLTHKHPCVELYRKGKLGKVIKKCIEINPNDRFQTVDEILNEIKNM